MESRKKLASDIKNTRKDDDAVENSGGRFFALFFVEEEEARTTLSREGDVIKTEQRVDHKNASSRNEENGRDDDDVRENAATERRVRRGGSFPLSGCFFFEGKRVCLRYGRMERLRTDLRLLERRLRRAAKVARGDDATVDGW